MRRKVLVIDDNLLDIIVIKRILEDEFDIISVSNGKDGIKKLKEKYTFISLVILDIVMPEMDGFEVLEEIRKNPLFYQIPVLMITSLNDDNTKERAIILGANGFINKPYNQVILKYSINNLIKLKETAALANMLKNDRLTSLYNRTTFFDNAQIMINRHHSGYYILSSIDVNRFKIINDQYGREIGDGILVYIANCIKEFICKVDGICGRISQDKFVALYPVSYIDSKELLESHKKVELQPYFNGEMRIRIGRYIVKDLSIPVETMYDRAVVAEESIKNNASIHIIEYKESMRDSLLKEQEIINNMESALINKNFIVYIQPQYNHSTGALIGGEALVRWKKEDTFIPPNEFISIFEENGFIYKMDQFVWEETCRLMNKWIKNEMNPLPISINISRVDFEHDDIINVLINIIDKYEISYDMIRLEITESAFSENSNVIEKVNKLIDLGFTVEIDDFGSGYSSLNTLKDVKAQILKLDMRFFGKTDYTERSGNIIEAVVRMAKWLEMAIIAEGVETIEYADYLKSIGCNYIQGYLYSKPLSIKEYENLLENKEQEKRLIHLKTLKTLDNNKFWDPESMDTLIFNSYVGGACIFEYCKGKAYLLRINNKYAETINPKATVEEVFTHNAILNMDQESKDKFEEAVKKAIETHDEVVIETIENSMDDPTIQMHIRSTMRVIAHTEDRYLFYSLIVNITEQKEAEYYKKLISEQMESVLNSMSSGLTATIIRNDKINVIFTNNRFYQMRGYTKEQYHKEVHNFIELVHPEDRKKVLEATSNEEAINRTKQVEYRIVKRDGSERWFRVTVTNTKFIGYKEKVTICTYADITMEKEKNIQEKLLLDNLPCGAALYIFNGEKIKVVHINKKYWELVERDALDYSKTSILDVVHEEDRHLIINGINEAIKNNSKCLIKCRILCANNILNILILQVILKKLIIKNT